MERKHKLLIVGGGPAGMMAAIAAAQHGVPVTLIDENPRLGGQIYRQLPTSFAINEQRHVPADQRRGGELIREVERHNVQVLTDTIVWGAFCDKRIAISYEGESYELEADALVFATGTYERVVPFPGWTLPGVITTGGTQRLLKNQGILPGARIIIAGSGPLQLIVANQLHKAGATVLAVIEASRLSYLELWRYVPAFWGHWDILQQAIGSIMNLSKAGIPYLRGHALVAAEGKDHVESAVVKQVDDTWTPVDGSEHTFDVDTVCTGFGFLSAYELPALAKCRLTYSKQYQAWIPWHDRNQQTSEPGIFVAGDCAGVEGVSTAMAQGRLAGIMAARYLGYCSNKHADHLSSSIRRRLSSLLRLRRALDEIFAVHPGIYTVLDEDTLICRCEEVSYATIRDGIVNDSLSVLNALKLQTRAGMGLCQGKFCGNSVSACIHLHTGTPLDLLTPFTPRPPIRPIPISSLV